MIRCVNQARSCNCVMKPDLASVDVTLSNYTEQFLSVVSSEIVALILFPFIFLSGSFKYYSGNKGLKHM